MRGNPLRVNSTDLGPVATCRVCGCRLLNHQVADGLCGLCKRGSEEDTEG